MATPQAASQSSSPPLKLPSRAVHRRDKFPLNHPQVNGDELMQASLSYPVDADEFMSVVESRQPSPPERAGDGISTGVKVLIMAEGRGEDTQAKTGVRTDDSVEACVGLRVEMSENLTNRGLGIITKVDKGEGTST